MECTVVEGEGGRGKRQGKSINNFPHKKKTVLVLVVFRDKWRFCLRRKDVHLQWMSGFTMTGHNRSHRYKDSGNTVLHLGTRRSMTTTRTSRGFWCQHGAHDHAKFQTDVWQILHIYGSGHNNTEVGQDTHGGLGLGLLCNRTHTDNNILRCYEGGCCWRYGRKDQWNSQG